MKAPSEDEDAASTRKDNALRWVQLGNAMAITQVRKARGRFRGKVAPAAWVEVGAYLGLSRINNLSTTVR